MGSIHMDQREYPEGLRLDRELIGDWGIESTRTLDIKKDETLNPETESGRTTVKYRRLCGGKKGPVD
jgi:hypothetical protein